MYVYNIIRTR